MRTVLLSDVCTITMGQAPPGASYNNRGEGIPLIAGAGDFKDGVISPTKFTTSPGKTCSIGDIILSIRASLGDKVWADGNYCLGRGVAGLRPHGDVDPQYLWHWLGHVEQELVSKGRGATFLQVSRYDIGQLAVHLSHLREQRRIAAILNQADAVRAKRREVLAHLDALPQAIFRQTFEVCRAGSTVGDVAQIQGGLQVSARRASLPISVPYLRVANAYRGFLDLEEIKTLQATESEIERTRLLPGDLLFVEGHANPLEVGRVSMWEAQVALMVHQNHLIRGRLDTLRVLPRFAMAWLNSSAGAEHFRRAGKTTSGLNTISAATVRSAPLPLPPLQQQETFTQGVLQVEAQRTRVESALAKDDELFASLQARAFRGEL